MESDIRFILNDNLICSKSNPSMVLLDFIRKNKMLTGTKEVCKEGDCGACAVLLGEYVNGTVKYKTINSCLYPIQKATGKHVVTIEGLNQTKLNPIQESFVNQGASQCGFCTPGFIISFTGYLLNSSKFNEAEAINSIAGNICRCTGYQSIKRSLNNVILPNEDISFEMLQQKNIIPTYFKEIPDKLKPINTQNYQNEQSLISETQIISGGTDLFVQKPDLMLDENIQLIENIITPRIRIESNNIIISGSATVEDFKIFMETHETNIKLSKLFQLFASLPIRNSATLAGNIINASPIADLTITLLALNAKLVLSDSKSQKRVIALNNFYAGYKTLNKNNDEFIEEISFNLPGINTCFNFEKVSKRTHLDIASVNSAILIHHIDDQIIHSSISAGGVAPIPLYLEKASEFLKNSNITKETLTKCTEIALTEISPISDIRGSSEYKSLLLSQLLKAHFIELFPKIITSEVLL